MVQQFTGAFVQALQTPDGPTADSGFKMEVLKVNSCCGREGLEGAAGSSGSSCFTQPLSLSLTAGGDSAGKELPEAHGVVHAADPADRLEHADRERGFISFPKLAGRPLVG